MDFKDYARVARLASAESTVLLRNEDHALPLRKGEKIAVFGRIQFDYYKSGVGSGGMVNVPYETNIFDSLKSHNGFVIDEKVENVYREWLKDHPFDRFYNEKDCWIIEPWSQEEMPLSDGTVTEAAKENDAAIIIFGRTAGEEKDVNSEKGSYYLSDIEMDMLHKVVQKFKRTIVVLNVSNIIDMSWVNTEKPSAVVYVWQGGMEGGNAAVDILSGKVNPCGKLSDTIAYELKDYPSHINFGGLGKNLYEEDIYVGYRYFETFAPEKVQYPFGFGLSYTTFEYDVTSFSTSKESVDIKVQVRNTGTVSGKEVIQLYLEKPQGKLGNPLKILLDFEKTGLLENKESQYIHFSIPIEKIGSYDDSGITGNKSAYVLEEGDYIFFIGNSVKNVKEAGEFTIVTTKIVRQLSEVLAPVEEFKRIKPYLAMKNTTLATQDYEKVPRRIINLKKRIIDHRPLEADYTGDRGWKLVDVKESRISMETFLAQLNNHELACLIRGEGMRSHKVTAGTAAAFGGVTESLKHFGIPIGCCADGPSGIRRDDGHQAFSLPNGTALACTFNETLVEELFRYVGKEIAENEIDILLAPGMNIHRHPLNGRNFEYFSEDPLLSGKIAAAEIRGIGKNGVSGTLKHFAANNQESARVDCNAVVSERALREIYLKGFEIALEESTPLAVMSTYGPINGIWTAGNYDLLTTVLREEWRFQGLVMTDWEARMNDEGKEASVQNTLAMVRAQNDLYMVVKDSELNYKNDNTLEGLETGKIRRGELVRNTKNICNVLMNLPTMDRFIKKEIKG